MAIARSSPHKRYPTPSFFPFPPKYPVAFSFRSPLSSLSPSYSSLCLLLFHSSCLSLRPCKSLSLFNFILYVSSLLVQRIFFPRPFLSFSHPFEYEASTLDELSSKREASSRVYGLGYRSRFQPLLQRLVSTPTVTKPL